MSYSLTTGGGNDEYGSGATFSDGPNDQLGFEVVLLNDGISFTPTFYPDSISQVKKKELDRFGGGNCGGESVSIKNIKNREVHATGVILESEIRVFHNLMDYKANEGKVDLISPRTRHGGLECIVKKAEIGEKQGWEPQARQWMFNYTLDFVSTGRDEYGNPENAIVTDIMNGEDSGDDEDVPGTQTV